MTGGVLHVRGTVVLDDDREAGEAWVVGGRLTFTRPAARVTATLDGWVLPGLVDVHCHIGLAADGPVDDGTAEKQALADRDSGVLLVRDAGSPADTGWVHDRDDLPRLIRSGRHLARPRRYLRHYGRELASVDDLPGAVREEAARGDGWVKLVADWIDRDLGPDGDLRPLWPRDVLHEAVAAAHAAGARVTAHTFATEALDDLLDAGVDCLEHATGATPEHVERIAAAGIPVTATLLQVARFEEIAAQGEARYPRFAARMRAMGERRYAHVRDLHDAGVRVLVGTDAGGTLGHGLVAQEAAELVRAGIPDHDVVAAASWRTRAWLGAEVLDEGASADVVVYAADPRRDVRVLADPRAVVLRGTRVR
ncbi:amidohydrolase family protein [Cellulomonas fimi]|uniref:Amidohydrolase n=1 Tax=Cellulomonas fimi (strain ATCC 484 / DSM 20113 / JCM 1341 / CCUG 24087 / LMG 16345 / NBRC 15513 / NCIMB 8980 / NCTC 7547 / NRS-133) TaxID=590998 RepID=F4H6K1_CELFA|nr:amidohydrolase family protein [Cellulomonas fimi]AEE45634.1 amidohydrolase [Cellulomonas fimi ATCC 484]NNH08072.1 amidohydrolase family protein [Cellulomonas fimi]VEH30132.1 Cytosine deaminase and related metal-dependent hydrolases [Cellulomonas fimi]